MHFNNITLLGIDCIDPKRTIQALRYSKRIATFHDVALVTDAQKHFELAEKCREWGIKVIHEKQGDRLDYEYSVLKNTPSLFSTNWVLFQEWDSCVINPSCFDDDWYEYDFIGAPWPYPYPEDGYPDCDHTNCVGNGGFSLKSKAFCQEVAKMTRRDDPAIKLSDSFMCRTLAKHIRGVGLKYAPHAVAERFSCENRFYSGEFGAHGKNTFEMNSWKTGFDWLV